MHLECLANELILDIFEYLNIQHLFDAYYGLNYRFNQLLIKFQRYHLDFRSISKNNFEKICEKYLPLILNEILSLHLSDNEETPNLPKIFLSSHFSINQFLHLQSISLYYIQSFEILNQLILQCNQLNFLIHLNLFKCYFNYHDHDMQYLINNIWKLKPLKSCIFDQVTSRKMRLTNISFISQSIQYLTFEKITCDFKDLSHLFEYTPNLQRISIDLTYGFPNQHLQNPILSIISLKIVYHGCIESLINLFENLPNLTYLTLETFDIYYNGYEWEKLFRNYLINIQKFHLKMNLNFPDYNSINQQANDLLNTFRNSFWIEEHQWFVRCDWDPSNIFSNGILYTLPYSFNDCFYFDAVSSISTCPTDTDYWIYDRVKILSHENPENDFAKDLNLFSARFFKIRQLKISFPFNENFWPCISSLNQLKSINITLLHTNLAYYQLQDLFNRATNLYSLKLSYSTDLPLRLFSMKSSSIRRLNLLIKCQSHTRYFDNKECFLLMNSSLIRQCEILLIGIKNRSNIINLINSIPNLRSLTCQCEDDEYNIWNSSSSSSSSTTTNDELIEWLKTHLSLTYSISRDEKRSYLIRLWIS